MDISPYVVGNKLNIEAEELKRQNYYKEAREKAEKAARALCDEFPNVEVYLFGSLTTEMFELKSDIDMASRDYLKSIISRRTVLLKILLNRSLLISFNLNLLRIL